MAPLVLHGVDDYELYVGKDGNTRPFAIINDAYRRRVETGPFGKSTRRSRSRTGTPALGRRNEDATFAASDRIFGEWISSQPAATSAASASSSGVGIKPALTDHVDGPGGHYHPERLSRVLDFDEGPSSMLTAASAAAASPHKQPTEVVLRGYRSSAHQYAAINHYEQIAGRICEDYARSPPAEQRRYRSELRDRAMTERRRLTSDERARVNRPAGGEHWVKVTFESADAADDAIHASPQRVLGHLVHCEPWTGSPPQRDEAVADVDAMLEDIVAGRSRPEPMLGGPVMGAEQQRHETHGRQQQQQQQRQRPLRRSLARGRFAGEVSPSDSRTSTHTAETATLSTSGRSATATDTTLMAEPPAAPSTSLAKKSGGTGTGTGTGADTDPLFCRRIPTARRVTIRPADEALLPRETWMQWLLATLPILQWFTGSMIGNEVPRRESGDFDYAGASLYWKMIWWLDVTFRLFGGEISSVEKEE